MDADLAAGSDRTDPASVKEQKMSESIAEIKKQLQAASLPGLPDFLKDHETFIRTYETDERSGVKKLVEQARKQIDAYEKELKRTESMKRFEKEYDSYSYICGIDEVGRGPLAGPVVAGTVILPKNCDILYLNDSKQLSEKKREELYEVIMEKAVSTGLGFVTPERIDEINILQATYEAMRMAIGELDPVPDLLLNDAVTIPEVTIRQVPIIKGDAKSISIAAASIIAKVTRDRLMTEYEKTYPGYGFAANKGYGSAEHIAAIRELGPPEELYQELSIGGVMRLSSLFTQGNQQIQENSRDMSFSTLEKGLRNGMKEMEGKMPGQSVTGEVIEADGQDILLAIGKNQLLRARLSLAMNVEAGQQLTFGIKSIGGMKVVLSPLFENMTSGSGAEKALELAGLPRNEETMKMVEAMMKEGMKLDPDSLSSMYRTVNAHMDADINTLVQLNRMGLPVTEENITQLQSYKNYEGQVTEGVKILMGEVAEQLSSLAASDNPEDVFTFLKVVLGEPSGTENVQTEENMAGDDNVIQTFKNAVMTEAPEENAGKEKLPFMPGMAEQAGEKGLGMALSDVLQKAGFPEETVNACLKGELPAKELLTELGRLVKDGRLSTEQKNGILELLKDNEFLENLKKGLTEKFLLTPDEVGEDGQVEKLYERLDSQLSRMNQALQGMAKENPALSQSIQNLSSNVEFMNQLNQMFTYVQLPLKLSGQEAAGELYVYTNKKNLAKKDGQVSALLHLDLEHLGEIDIHVSLRDSHVSTKFCLSDEKALDLVAANIDTLNQRLMKRGYSMDASFEQKDKAQHPIDEMLDRDKKVSSKEKVLISSSSFDARA